MSEETSSDLRPRMVALEQTSSGYLARIVALELWQRSTEIASAKMEVQYSNMDKRFDDLTKKIDGVGNILARIMWIILTALLLAVVGFVVAGGLKII